MKKTNSICKICKTVFYNELINTYELPICDKCIENFKKGILFNKKFDTFNSIASFLNNKIKNFLNDKP